MSENPYNAPLATGEPSDGRRQLVPVAIALIVVSLLWVFMALSGIVYFYSAMNAPQTDMATRNTFTTYMLYICISIAYSLVLVSGAFSMVRRGSYVWAVATSCLAMVPLLGPCYFLGIPVGIWALIVLRKPGVRDSFQKP